MHSWLSREVSVRYKALTIGAATALIVAIAATAAFTVSTHRASANSTSYDITTPAGKVASVHGTAGLQIRFSAFIEQEADEEDSAPAGAAITPTNVLSSPLDGTSVTAPDVTVNQDTAAAPQNETAIAVDPNNSSRVVAAANDYAPRAWSCMIVSPAARMTRAATRHSRLTARGTCTTPDWVSTGRR